MLKIEVTDIQHDKAYVTKNENTSKRNNHDTVTWLTFLPLRT